MILFSRSRWRAITRNRSRSRVFISNPIVKLLELVRSNHAILRQQPISGLEVKSRETDGYVGRGGQFPPSLPSRHNQPSVAVSLTLDAHLFMDCAIGDFRAWDNHPFSSHTSLKITPTSAFAGSSCAFVRLNSVTWICRSKPFPLSLRMRMLSGLHFRRCDTASSRMTHQSERERDCLQTGQVRE